MVLNLVRLRSFVEVAERGTVAAASEALGYTPPAVSQHLAKLERELDTSLFERVSGQLKLAPAGDALLPLAQDMLDLADRAQRTVQAPAPNPSATITGFASAIAGLVVPNLARLAEIALLDIVESEDEPALRELRLGHADIALVQEYPSDDVDRDPRLSYSVVVQDELRLVLPASMPARTTVADLANDSWLVNGHGTRCAAATHQILHAAGVLDAQIRGDIMDNQTLIRLVAAGHGVTMVPDLVLAETVAAVTVATQPLGVRRTLLAVTRRPPSSTVRSIVEVFSPA
jgi:DNA-binding transcriptional LysR family regulator